MQSKGCLQGKKYNIYKYACLASFCLQTLLVLLNHLLEDGGFSPRRLLSPEPLTAHGHPGQRSLPLHVLAKILAWTFQNWFWSRWADLAETVGRKQDIGTPHWSIRGWVAGQGRGQVSAQGWAAVEEKPQLHAQKVFSHCTQHRT